MSSAFSRYNNEKRQQQAANVAKIEIKKAKYEDNTLSSSFKNSNGMQYEEEDEEEEEAAVEDEIVKAEEEEEEEEEEMNEEESTPTIIGVETFNNSNILFDLQNQTSSTNSGYDQAVDDDVDDDDLLLLSLDLNEKFTFKGKIMLKILNGSVEINGFKLSSKKHKNRFYNLYSPESHSSLVIENRGGVEEDEEDTDEIIQNLTEMNKNLNKNKIIDYLNENHSKSIVLFKKLKSKLCNYFNRFDNFKQMYQATHLINYITNPNDIKFAYLGIHPVDSVNSILSFNQNDCQTIHEIVSKTLTNRQKQEIILACGGKDVGKSTYLRYLVNSLLNSQEKVAYLDCDPGQCEFTLSGNDQLTIVNEALMGPPHAHLMFGLLSEDKTTI